MLFSQLMRRESTLGSIEPSPNTPLPPLLDSTPLLRPLLLPLLLLLAPLLAPLLLAPLLLVPLLLLSSEVFGGLATPPAMFATSLPRLKGNRRAESAAAAAVDPLPPLARLLPLALLLAPLLLLPLLLLAVPSLPLPASSHSSLLPLLPLPLLPLPSPDTESQEPVPASWPPVGSSRCQVRSAQLQLSTAIPFSASLFISSDRICTSMGNSSCTLLFLRSAGVKSPFCSRAAARSRPVGTTCGGEAAREGEQRNCCV